MNRAEKIYVSFMAVILFVVIPVLYVQGRHPEPPAKSWDVTIDGHEKGLATFVAPVKPWHETGDGNCWVAAETTYCGVVLIAPHVEVKAEGPKEGK